MANKEHLDLLLSNDWDSWRQAHEDIELDLVEADLREARLNNHDLQQANLSKADLRGAMLSNANLFNTNLSGANLQGAFLGNAYLKEADLTEADLTEARLMNAVLYKAKLRGAILDRAYLQDANLNRADLQKASLRSTTLSKAKLRLANLSNAHLEDTDLVEANLSGANLQGTIRINVDLYGAILDGTILEKDSKSNQNQIANIAKADPANIQEVGASLFALSGDYYKNVLRQSRHSFISASIWASIGTALIVAAIIFFLIQQLSNLSYISLIGGIVVEAIAGLNFYLYGKASEQLAAFQIPLDRIGRYQLANSVCENIVGEAQHVTRAKLVEIIANASLTEPLIDKEKDNKLPSKKK